LIYGGSHQTTTETILKILKTIGIKDEHTAWEIGFGRPSLAFALALCCKEVIASEIGK
jgi:16S rRNA A1518/A1519 N6-dimethyltransferase RsmA/KsgA/DIM1 with predicted DNA glycosylase/AP lyase activity